MATLRAFGAILFTTEPEMEISPLVICSRPAIIRSKVDLPQPEGPTSTTNSPSLISTSTPRITSTAPNDFVTLRISTAATDRPLFQLFEQSTSNLGPHFARADVITETFWNDNPLGRRAPPSIRRS